MAVDAGGGGAAVVLAGGAGTGRHPRVSNGGTALRPAPRRTGAREEAGAEEGAGGVRGLVEIGGEQLGEAIGVVKVAVCPAWGFSVLRAVARVSAHRRMRWWDIAEAGAGCPRSEQCGNRPPVLAPEHRRGEQPGQDVHGLALVVVVDVDDGLLSLRARGGRAGGCGANPYPGRPPGTARPRGRKTRRGDGGRQCCRRCRARRRRCPRDRSAGMRRLRGLVLGTA